MAAIVGVASGRKEALRGHIAMLSFSALIAGSFSLGGMAANDIAPQALIAARFFFSAILVVGVGVTMGVPLRQVARTPWRYLVLGGLFAFYFVLMFEGLKTATPVSIAAVFTLTPLITAGIAWVILRQITTPYMALALVIGGVGAVWVIFQADFSALMSFRLGRGEAVFFWGMVAHAFYTPLARLLNRGEHPVVMTLGTLLAGFAVLLVVGWSEIVATDWLHLPGMVWVLIGYMAVFSGAVTLALIQYATLRLPSAKVMAYTYLTPSWVILWEVALGHGAPAGLILPGVVLTVVALWMLVREG